MKISIFNSHNAANTQLVNSEYEGDIRKIAEKILTSSWSPFTFEYIENYKTNRGKIVSGKIRNSKYSKTTEMLVFDIDEGLSIERAKMICDDLGSSYIIGTTKSHQLIKGDAGACDRFRVILFLKRPINVQEEYKKVWESVKAYFPSADEQCKDLARFYFPCREIVEVVDERT